MRIQEKIDVSGFVAWIVILGCYSVLASAGVFVFNSPDETAYAFIIDRVAHGLSFTLSDSLVQDFPWLHPRSFVSTFEGIVPVGFPMWSIILALFARVSNLVLTMWIGSVFLSTAFWPWYQMLRARVTRHAALFAASATMLAPPLVLYGNRTLFPNFALLTAILWVTWWLDYLVERRVFAFRMWFGWTMVAMLALFIRPVEAIWIVPIWMIWLRHASKRVWPSLIFGVCAMVVAYGLFQAHVYGSWFKTGYQLHDIATSSAIVSAGVADHVAGFNQLLPYGFHPRHIWLNIRVFFLQRLWPWTFILVVGIWIVRKRITRAWLLAIGWSVVVLFGVYGSGLYRDHVRMDAFTWGNSFLRYLLPYWFLLGWVWAELLHMMGRKSRGKRFMAYAASVALVVFGVVAVLYPLVLHDDESVLSVRREVLRYAQIRSVALAIFSSKDVILSDRSDKIFFPLIHTATPVPTMKEVRRLLQNEKDRRIGLFAQTLSQDQERVWAEAGIRLQPWRSFGRETLYLLTLL